MARLADLPNELLQAIMIFASCDDFDRECLETLALINKKLRTVAFPLLVRNWKDSLGSGKIRLLALHLLRYPQHRSQLRWLDLNCSDIRKPDAKASLRPESCEKLADEAERTLPDLTKSNEDWVNSIRMGFVDAIVVLILAWATGLTVLRLHTRGCGTFHHQVLFGRCISRLSRLSIAELDVEYLLPTPANPESIASDSDLLVSQLPEALKRLTIKWHMHAYIDMDFSPIGLCRGKMEPLVQRAIHKFLQEAGLGRKFSKLRYFYSPIPFWPGEIDQVVERAKSRGVIFMDPMLIHNIPSATLNQFNIIKSTIPKKWLD